MLVIFAWMVGKGTGHQDAGSVGMESLEYMYALGLR